MSNVILADLLYQYNPIEFKEYMETHEFPSDCHRLLIESFCQYMQKELPTISKDSDLYDNAFNTLLEHIVFSDTDRLYLVFSLLLQKVTINSIVFDLPNSCKFILMLHVFDIEKEIGLDGFLVNQFPNIKEILGADNLFNVKGDYTESLDYLVNKTQSIAYRYKEHPYIKELNIHTKELDWEVLKKKVTYMTESFKNNSSNIDLNLGFREQTVSSLKNLICSHFNDFVELVEQPHNTLVFSSKDRQGFFQVSNEKILNDFIRYLDK